VHEASNNAIIDYTLSVQGVSQSFTCGTPIEFGGLKQGRIDILGDTDVFTFNATADDGVSINIGRSGESGNPCWRLFGPDGLPITSFPICGLASVSLSQDGTYTPDIPHLPHDFDAYLTS
jgi:hypothetical protein